MSNARFSIIQARAVRDTAITNSQFRTLSALGIYGDEYGWCFPKLATLGKDLGKSKQAVSKDIKALCKLGYVEKQKQFREDGSQRCNLYRLVFDGGGKRGVDGGSTSEVDGGSTSEVDALTTHVNDPKEEERKSKIFTQLQGLNIFTNSLVDMVDSEIKDWDNLVSYLQDDHPDKKISGLEAMEKACELAVKAGASSFGYIEKCFDNWRKGGYGYNPNEKKNGHKKEKPLHEQMNMDSVDELIERGEI